MTIVKCGEEYCINNKNGICDIKNIELLSDDIYHNDFACSMFKEEDKL